ncbi:MAG: DUF2127 domain-containing protein [Xanthomonadaceae bacterium]|nr:DUF2127 domain-containing protein [Xanthomonadaceae bacterium]MDE1962417.1 DUF2127 domain-containing protein [Xanthomonadaceae bacterium]
MSRHPLPHNQDDDSPESRHRFGLRLIAAYKIVQALALVIAGAAAFQLHRQRTIDELVDWLEHLSMGDTGGLRHHLIDALAQWGPGRFVAIGAIALAYAALFLTEGIGLWLRRHWAEWFTVIATGSLIPVELYELLREPSWIKLAVLAGNVAIVVYLARIAMQPHRRRA